MSSAVPLGFILIGPECSTSYIVDCLIYPFLNCSEINSCTSSLSSLDNRYTLPFLGTNPSFVSMVWFYNFLIGIYSLAFFPKIWICLWKYSSTSFFTSSSFHISHSSATLFISIVLSFLGFEEEDNIYCMLRDSKLN